MLEGRRGIVFLGILFVCGLVCGSTAWGEDKLAEQAKSVKVEATTPVVAKSAVEKHEEILQQPVKVEIKAGTTLGDAIKKLGAAAGLEVELEESFPQMTEHAYRHVLKHGVSLNASTFQDGLNTLGADYARDTDHFDEMGFLAFENIAIPTSTGVLISNTWMRITGLCDVSTKIYSIQDLANTPKSAEELSRLIYSHAKALWIPHKETSLFDAEQLVKLRLSRQTSTLHVLNSKRLLVIRTSRSAHYEIQQLLKNIRKASKLQEEQRQRQWQIEQQQQQQQQPVGGTGSLF